MLRFRFPLALGCCTWLLLSGVQAAVPAQLDWDGVAWTPDGALSQSYTVGPGDIDIQFSGETASFVNFDGRPSPNRSTLLTGGITPAEFSLGFRADHPAGATDEVTITIDFTHPGGVSDVAFQIFDIDSLFFNHVDVVEVTATDGSSIFNPSAVTTSRCNTFDGVNTVTGTCFVGTASADGNVSFTFNQSGITRVTVVYRNAIPVSNPGPQEIAVHDIGFSYPEADLSLAKVVDNPTPDVGDDVVFTLTVDNAGGDDATGVEVSDLLPSGYAYVTDDGGGAYDAVTGLWIVGALAASGSAVLNITATVNGVGTYENVAEISASDQSDPDSTPGNNQPAEDDQDSATVTRQPLSVVKRAFQLDGTPIPDGGTGPVGARIRFMLYINNRGGALTDVSLQDVLDPSFVYIADSIRFDNSVPGCALTACTVAEEATIFAAADAGTSGTDVVDGDVVSFTTGTVDAGDDAAANARLDVADNRVWAMVFTVRVQ